MRIKTSLSIFLLIAAVCTIDPAYAYENEPDGFRGVAWGTEYSRLTGFSPDGVYAQRLEEFARKGGPRFLTFPMVSYSNRDDKLEFSDIPVTGISYAFFNGKLISATINFFDNTNSPIGKAYLNSWGQKPPEAYNCRRRFNIDHLCRLNIDQGLKLAA
jgi:hypothetical protein